MAYDAIEPFGDERADFRQAITSAILASVYRKQGAQPSKPQDFMPFSKKERPQHQTLNEMVSVAALIAAAYKR